MEIPHRSRFQARPAVSGEQPMVEQLIWWKLPSIGNPCWSSLFLKDGPGDTVFEELQHMGPHRISVGRGFHSITFHGRKARLE